VGKDKVEANKIEKETIQYLLKGKREKAAIKNPALTDFTIFLLIFCYGAG
jgi:hypothetical protein